MRYYSDYEAVEKAMYREEEEKLEETEEK